MAPWLPILTFHALDDRSSAISFPPGLFQRGLAGLHELGYRTLDLADAAGRLRRGEAVPDRAFVITFDDGHESVYSQAFRTLADRGMSATVFLRVGSPDGPGRTDGPPVVGERGMLTWRQIVEMRDGGLTFGAHTLTHPDLTRLSADRIETEVGGSKSAIEDRLGAAVTCFAYPYGRYDRRSREIVRRHFACACSDQLGLATARSDPYALERIDAYYLRTDRLFALMRGRGLRWYLLARGLPRRLRRAVRRVRP